MVSRLHQHDAERNPRLRGKRCCFCLAVLAVPLIVVLWFYVFAHDWNLWKLDRSFRLINHPTGTMCVVHKRELGLLIGNGNHCDYFVGELRTYSVSKPKVSQFYERMTVLNPVSGKKEGLEVAFIDNGEVRGYKYPEFEVPDPIVEMARSLKQKHDKNRYYIVYILDAGHDVGLDIRCI